MPEEAIYIILSTVASYIGALAAIKTDIRWIKSILKNMEIRLQKLERGVK